MRKQEIHKEFPWKSEKRVDETSQSSITLDLLASQFVSQSSSSFGNEDDPC